LPIVSITASDWVGKGRRPIPRPKPPLQTRKIQQSNAPATASCEELNNLQIARFGRG
jgi:hypothetical protein